MTTTQNRKLACAFVSAVVLFAFLNSELIGAAIPLSVLLITRIWPLLGRDDRPGFYVCGVINDFSLLGFLFTSSVNDTLNNYSYLSDETSLAFLTLHACNIIALGIKIPSKYHPLPAAEPQMLRIIRLRWSPAGHIFAAAILLLLGIGVTAFAVSLGLIGRGLQLRETALPFRLGGIINLLHITVLPFLFLAVIESQITNGANRYQIILVIGMYFALGFAQTILVNSRGQFLLFVPPLAIMLYAYWRSNVIPIIAGFTFLGLSFALVPVLTVIREAKIFGATESLSLANISINSTPIEHLEMLSQRIFMQLGVFQKYFDFLRGGSISLDTVASFDGFKELHTRLIDGFPPGYPHSSGTTSLGDSYILFGWLGVVLWGFIAAGYFHAVFGSRLLDSTLPRFLRAHLDWVFISYCLGSSLFEVLLFDRISLGLLLLLIFVSQLVSRKHYV